jgi:hypothetical protein
MKDSEGRFTTLVWVVGKEYNEDRGGWDYKLRQRPQTELKRA